MNLESEIMDDMFGLVVEVEEKCECAFLSFSFLLIGPVGDVTKWSLSLVPRLIL